MKINLPDNISRLLHSIPEQERPQGDEEAKFWNSVAWELNNLIKEAAPLEKAELVFNDVRQSGSQYIWEFYVNDLSRPLTNAMNFHGQFCSQWVYAGCVLLQNGRVSLHH